MHLNSVYETEDEIPEAFRDLFTERNGQWELTRVQGIKTQADFDRTMESLRKERNDHKATKEKLGKFGDLDPDDVFGKLDRFDELEAIAAGKIDQDDIDAMVEKQVQAKINSQTAPLQRQLSALQKQAEEAAQERDTLLAEKKQRAVHDHVREALTKAKVRPEAFDDALLNAERVFEITEDGHIMTRDNVGVTPGVTADVWLQDMQGTRPHWWPESVGGGAGGTKGKGGGGANPWAKNSFNLTEQGRIMRENPQRAEMLKKQAGAE